MRNYIEDIVILNSLIIDNCEEALLQVSSLRVRKEIAEIRFECANRITLWEGMLEQLSHFSEDVIVEVEEKMVRSWEKSRESLTKFVTLFNNQ